MQLSRYSDSPLALMCCALALSSNGGSASAQSIPPAAPAASSPTVDANNSAAIRPLNLPATLSLASRVTTTDNGGLNAPGAERRDLIVSLRPEIAFATQGAKFHFDFRGAANFVDYADGTQANGVLPDVSSTLKSSLIDNWLYFDAGWRVQNSAANLLDGRSYDGMNSVNRRTESGYNLAPYVERHFDANLSMLVRGDHGVLTNAAGDGARLTTDNVLLRLERKPVPFGFLAELSRLVNRTEGGNSLSSSKYTLDTARLKGNLNLAEQWQIAAILGSDRSQYLTTHTDPLYGAEVDWSPSVRTRLSAELEHRYFGKAANVNFEHRTPFFAVNLLYRQQPVDSSVSLGSVGQGGSLRNLLDAILTTRYPDPTVRSGIVEGVINSGGLNTQAAGAVDIVGDYPQLQTVARATVTYLSSRNTVSVSVYSQTNRQLIWKDDPLSAIVPATSDFRQTGADLQLNHKLTPNLSVTAMVLWAKVAGLGVQQGQNSDQRNFRIALSENISPKSTVSLGLERSRFVTTAIDANSYTATLAFLGLVHRF